MFTQDSGGTTEKASVIPLGFILLLGIAVIGMHVYELNYVPDAGMEAEVESNRAMLSDVQTFDFAIRQTLSGAPAQPVAIGSPVTYPITLPTPPDPTYVVATTENETISVDNYQCESGDCQTTMNTTTVLFLGNYNYLQNDRVYGYEYGIVYSAPNSSPEGDTGVVTYNDQFVMKDNNITLVAFQGNFSYERRDTVHTTISPQQTASHTFVISDDGRAVNLTLPTELSEGRWESLMEDQLVENGGHIKNITYTKYNITDGSTTGTEQHHWEECDSSGGGQPFVSCTVDNSTNYVTFTLEKGENYTIETEVMELSK